MTGIQVSHLSFRYGLRQSDVLTDVSFAVGAESITGLLGRNGSGKSTIGLLLAGLLAPREGEITWNGRPVFEDAHAMSHICYSGDTTAVFEDEKLAHTLELWAMTRPGWDPELAGTLLDMFAINPKKKPSKLSRGQRSAFYAALGLASRAAVTIFDEVHLGMDAVVREIFYRTLLADYTKHPRAFIISSHLIEEIEKLLDHVIMVDQGKIIESGDVDDVRARYSQDGKVRDFTEILMHLTLTDNQRLALGQ